jgi:hypothetical protein
MLSFRYGQISVAEPPSSSSLRVGGRVDTYFSADIETDGPPYSMLSFALVYAGTFDGKTFIRPENYNKVLYRELKPISQEFETEALLVNGLDRERLKLEGIEPSEAMSEAFEWINENAMGTNPVLVAYPVSFDWTWLYWYFVRFGQRGSPFGYSQCFDIKTAFAVKSSSPISSAGRSKMRAGLRSNRVHTHHAIDDAIEQAEIFANVFEWEGRDDRDS